MRSMDYKMIPQCVYNSYIGYVQVLFSFGPLGIVPVVHSVLIKYRDIIHWQ